MIDPELNLAPADEHNRKLVANVHPSDWRNPKPEGRYNMVVLGAGTAGLVAAAGAAGMGAKVALVERSLMGGDCLNVGCVPSKAMIRSAHAAHDLRTANRFGLRLSGEVEDTGKGKYGKDGLYPISWCDEYGEGRIFYCSLGHRDEIFWNPVVLQHYLAGIQFALGDLEADATPKKVAANGFLPGTRVVAN